MILVCNKDRDRKLEEAGAEQGQVDSLGGGGTVVGGIYVGKWAQRSLKEGKALSERRTWTEDSAKAHCLQSVARRV